MATANLMQWGCQARLLTGLVDQSFVLENKAMLLTEGET
jgi:hypothetical protein